MSKYELGTLRTYVPTPLVKLLMNFLALRTCVGARACCVRTAEKGGL